MLADDEVLVKYNMSTQSAKHSMLGWTSRAGFVITWAADRLTSTKTFGILY